MTIKQRYQAVISYFKEQQPVAESELHYNNPFELLVAVILSAQCTDKRVNMVTPVLLQRFPNPQVMSEASVDEILHYIRSISYPNHKASHLQTMAQQLINQFDGKVPQTVEELMTLQGVGRKTANVVASICFNAPVIAVDTHVFRVAHRIGLVHSKAQTPFLVEQELTKNFPAEIRGIAHHWLILHGRYICTAKKPKCLQCGITTCCKSFVKEI